jgi:hypothetical protein
MAVSRGWKWRALSDDPGADAILFQSESSLDRQTLEPRVCPMKQHAHPSFCLLCGSTMQAFRNLLYSNSNAIFHHDVDQALFQHASFRPSLAPSSRRFVPQACEHQPF